MNAQKMLRNRSVIVQFACSSFEPQNSNVQLRAPKETWTDLRLMQRAMGKVNQTLLFPSRLARFENSFPSLSAIS